MDKRFIIGSINQGRHKVGDIFSAYEQNTIFLTGVCAAESYLDGPLNNQEDRSFLKNIGSLLLRINSIKTIDENSRIAELEMDDKNKEKYETAMQFLFRDNLIGYFHQEPTLMTMTKNTALKEGDYLNLGYFSVFEPLGSGMYRLRHDYPTQWTQGNRYE